MRALPAQKWLVQKLLPEQGFACIYGASGSGKSFIAQDLGASIAAGKTWCGLKVQQAPVVFCVLEGQSGFKNRASAWEAKNGELAADFLTSLQDFDLTNEKDVREAAGIKHKTINLTLGAVRLILNLAATTWKHANNQYWLDRAPKLTMLPLEGHERPPMPISWDEQSRLLDALPIHLKRMALFTLNTCVRDDVVCNLQWSWEVRSKQLPFSVFEVPKEHVKGQKSSRLLVCNSVAMSILDSVRGMHPTHVFVYRRERVKNLDQPAKMPYRPIKGVSNTAWETAREKAGLGDLHFHDLRHTASTRLGSQKVSQKAISEILWHGKKGTTEHYQAAVMMEMRDALELISKPDGDIRHLSWGMVKRAQKWEENSPIPPKVPHDDSEQSAVVK